MNFYFGNLLLRSYSYEALGITDFNFDLNVLENQAMFKDVTNDLYQDVKPYVVISGNHIHDRCKCIALCYPRTYHGIFLWSAP